MKSLKQRAENIDAVMKKAASKTPCRLIAVSKQQPDEKIVQALDAGLRIFGENRVQEAAARWGERFVQHRDGLELHLIGPLQSNKTADACALFDVIHTLDRSSLAKALAKYRDGGGKLPRLLVQVNTGEEEQKSGVMPAKLSAFLRSMDQDYGLTIEGLMCIPPVDEAPGAHFWLLRTLAADHGLSELSMGMSADYDTAAKLGATYVRVGSALFGARS
ncbi:YggS family pyridoxal phosphate-dependent enzyme [Robiginitomaculum antarcticum]|uniref:YggS family pyridoxal phosphate-dependent enzyme n=1 Tax=Robiginitomaculum antarcticum TaxID=437507 RepID=UPI000366EA1D|nr:YggS family pyridoxal phosphate-dependent enzyme [Robiginitomaculum antarcticum]